MPRFCALPSRTFMLTSIGSLLMAGTTYKTYHGTHRGELFGIAPTGRKIQFETVDVMRVQNGKITEHWGVTNLFSLMQQLGALPDTPKA